jgi:hypothetical protein
MTVPPVPPRGRPTPMRSAPRQPVVAAPAAAPTPRPTVPPQSRPVEQPPGYQATRVTVVPAVPPVETPHRAPSPVEVRGILVDDKSLIETLRTVYQVAMRNYPYPPDAHLSPALVKAVQTVAQCAAAAVEGHRRPQ